MTKHVCSSRCSNPTGTPETNWSGRLGFYKSHVEGDLKWFEDVFIGPRAVYLLRDKIGRFEATFASPLEAESARFAFGPFATSEEAWKAWDG